MQLSEPITTLTDYAITVMAIACAVSLAIQGIRQSQKSVLCWAIAFALVGLGAFLGGTVHGTAYLLSVPIRLQLWTLTMLSVGLSGSVLLLGTVFSAVRKSRQPWWMVGIAIATLIYIYGVFEQHSFLYPITAYLIALGIVTIFQLGTWRHQPSSTALWILSGIGISLFAAIVLAGKFLEIGQMRSSDWYHLIQLPGLYALYRGVRQFKDMA